MKNVFFFMLKVLLVGHVGKQLHKKAKVDFKIYASQARLYRLYASNFVGFLKPNSFLKMLSHERAILICEKSLP